MFVAIRALRSIATCGGDHTVKVYDLGEDGNHLLTGDFKVRQALLVTNAWWTVTTSAPRTQTPPPPHHHPPPSTIAAANTVSTTTTIITSSATHRHDRCCRNHHEHPASHCHAHNCNFAFVISSDGNWQHDHTWACADSLT
jgi:hypothetical protein